MRNSRFIIRLISFVLILWALTGCSSAPPRVFNAPAPSVLKANKALFDDAFEAQEKAQYRKAISLWKDFLQKEPDSVQAHNNLGMVFYAEDRLTESITELETAYNLEPGNEIVVRNLSRSLQFQVALLKENREYERAIRHLNRLREISRPEENQKIQFMIEEVEDRIYEQVQNANTVDKYRWYLEHYPTGINAEKARRKLAELQDRQSSMVQSFEDREKIDSSGVLNAEQPRDAMAGISEENVGAAEPIMEEEVMEQPVAEPPVMEETPVKEEPLKEEPVSEIPMEAPPGEMAQEGAPGIEETPVMEEPPAAQKPVEPTEQTEVEPPPAVKAEPVKVIITLNNPDSSLRVRAKPNTGSPVLIGIKHGEIRPLVEENKGWFKIEYEPGKTGWVSKKFSKKLKPGTDQSQPQAKAAPMKKASG